MNVETSAQLKALQSRKARLQGQLPSLKSDMQEASHAYSKALNSVKNIDNEIEMLTKDDSLVVSEHAMLRYIERVVGVDLEDMRQDIISQVEAPYRSLGNGKYPIHGGRVVVKDNVIITVES